MKIDITNFLNKSKKYNFHYLWVKNLSLKLDNGDKILVKITDIPEIENKIDCEKIKNITMSVDIESIQNNINNDLDLLDECILRERKKLKKGE